LQCFACDQVLGNVDSSTEGWKLYKWSVRVQKEDSVVESFSVPRWISTQLLAAVENSGVRRFVVESTAEPTSQASGMLVRCDTSCQFLHITYYFQLQLWLFTDSLAFSSSHEFHLRRDPTRAMKILWKPIDNAAEVMDKYHFSHEQLVFPPHVFDILRQTLVHSAKLLPETARKFQDWRVGLLERFSWEDIQGTDAKVREAPKAENFAEKDKQNNGTTDIWEMEGSATLFE